MINPEREISELEILSGEEKKQILYDFNDTTAHYPEDKTIPQLFAEQAARTPDHIALIDVGTRFIASDSPKQTIHVTYHEFNQKSEQLAGILTGKGVKPDTIVAIMMERSLEMIIGLLGILKAGGAYLPINPEFPGERIRYMLTDSASKILVTTQDLSKGIQFANDIIYISDAINPLRGRAAVVPTPHHPHLSPWVNAPVTSLAYIIYTSGTTGKSKGTLTTHANVIRVVRDTNYINLTTNDRILQLSNYAFDGSVFDIYGALLNGAALVMIKKENVLSAYQLSQTITKRVITVFFVTTALFNILLDLEIQCLSRIRKVLFGGERVSVAHAKKALEYLNKNRIIHVYGPTETTVYATYYHINSIDENRRTIPIGYPLNNTTTYIINKSGQLVPIGVPGELVIGGYGVARGYLNKVELTKEKFVRDPFVKGERLYRSGDIARWLSEGSIEFIGRIDSQVKIRGFRVEPGETEKYLLENQEVKEALVIAREEETGEKYLCAYIISDSSAISPSPDSSTTGLISRLQEYLSRELPDYMVPAQFVMLEKIPLNPNGKVDIKALPKPGIKRNQAVVLPRDRIEKHLAELWSLVLAMEKERISIDDDFFQLGGHSLKATTLASLIHKVIHVKLPLMEIFNRPTIRRLSQYIKEAVEEHYSPIKAIEEKEYYLLSPAQRRLYFLHRLDETTSAYNISCAWLLKGLLDKDKLKHVFSKLIQRHESLRTSFLIIDEEPVQRIHKYFDFEIEYFDSKIAQVEVESEFIRPFDLLKVPLIRVGLVEIEKNKHIFMVDMHHIVSDGTSAAVLVKEFMSLYDDEEFPPLRLRYKDFSQWQRSKKQKALIKRQGEYWLEEFVGDIPVLNLPYDFSRPLIQGFTGSSLEFKIGAEETKKLKHLALAEGSTLYMVLLALFNIFLSKVSGQEDIVVGSPAAGRKQPGIEQIIGIFINTLALRNYPTAEKSITVFLREVKENTLKAQENQDYPFEELVEIVEVNRDTSRNPLFDVMLVLQNMEQQKLQIPGLTLNQYPYESKKSKFDMTVTVVEHEDNLSFTFTYNRDLFKKTTIQRFIEFFKRIAAASLENPLREIADIEIIPGEEKKRVLYDFNATSREYPKGKSIHLLFEEQVRDTADYIAVVGNPEMPDTQERQKRGTAPIQITYKEFNARANQLGRLLRAKGVKPDSIAGIMTDPSLEMMLGIMAILKAGGGYLPIDPLQPAVRTTYMLKDSRASVLLTSHRLAESLHPDDHNGQQRIYLDEACIYTGDGTNLETAGKCQDVLYTIYTSGTTGKSKGTLVENKNLLNYIHWFKQKVHLAENDRTVLTSSFGFDLGYTNIYSSILSGCQLHLIPREVYLSPEDLLGYMILHQVTYIKVTPSLFSTIVGSAIFSREACQNLRLVLLGGEEIRLQDVEKAHGIGGHMEIMNHYGPTEATIGCVARFIDFNRFDQYKKHPTIGAPIDNMKAVILDNGLILVPVGVAGELCVSGAGVARGYLNQPELTARKFDQDLWDYQDYHDGFHRSYRSYKSYILYKTGDMARWLTNGMIEFLGRIDSQVKIRGYRVETGEIRELLLKHKAVKDAVVIPLSHPPGDKYLCAYIVGNADEMIDPAALQPKLNEYLADKLPDYMVPPYFVTVDRIPLTPNGKLNRKLLPEPGIKIETGYVPPGDAMEEKLVEIWTGVLSPGSLHPSIGIDDNFFHKGGHSLTAIILISGIHKVFHVNIPLAEIFKKPTIRGISAYIKTRTIERFTSIEPVEERDYYRLSSAQKRLYILKQMDESGTGYNMPVAIELEGEIDKGKLDEVFLKLIHRHESLRTSFRMVNEEPAQGVHDQVEFEIEYFLATESPGSQEPGAKSCIKNFIRPFDLSHAPLLRVGLIKTGNHNHILLVDIHHIIGDGISRRLLLEEFTALMAGKDLPGLKLRYKDYAQWQNKETNKETLSRQKNYWKKQIEGETPVLDLPTDFTRPGVQRFEGKHTGFELDQDETAALKTLAQESGATLYMVLLAIYYIFLSKLTNQEDILVGTPTMGRRHADLGKILGMFVNTLVLRNYPNGEKTYNKFLKKIKERSLEAFENQDYQYEDLVGELKVTRDASRNPFFDTMFVMQNMGQTIGLMEIPGMKLAPFEYLTSKFDLTFIVSEPGDELQITIEYSTNLFKEATIKRFITYFTKVASTIIRSPLVKIANIEILAEEEKKQVLYDFNTTGAEYPRNKTIHDLFENQVKKTPDHAALVGPMAQQGAERGYIAITYNELNVKSHQLAHLLIEKGVHPDTIVGIMIERSIEMIVSLLGILNAGSAYLPIDPDYPEDRINYLLKDSGAKILLTTEDIAETMNIGTEIVYLSTSSPPALYLSAGRLPVFPTSLPSNLAYVIYTSGSSGKPKGVLVEHLSVVNLAFAQKKRFNISSGDRILQFSTICFDASVEQIFIAFLSGAGLVLIDKGTLLDAGRFEGFIASRSITHLHAVPSFLSNMGLKDTYHLKRIISGGDVCPVSLAKRWTRHCDFYNEYGPTETTVTSIEMAVEPVDEILRLPGLPVGRPIGNTFVYLLDKWKAPVPLGVIGELYIGGHGVARGYLNRPQLTAEKFCLRRPGGRFLKKLPREASGTPRKNFSLKGTDQEHFLPYSPHSPIYRTGDLARWLADGNIEFLGRIDRQVKVRGFRIEPGEIANRLLKHEQVKEALVVAKEDKDGDKYLAAYIVSDREKEISFPGLREYLSKALPDYMVPAYFMRLDQLPLTPTGKVDHRALPAPGFKSYGIYIAPGDEVEKELAGIWSDVLGTGAAGKGLMGIDDNFFHLGGHSLKATILAAKIHKVFNVKVPLVEIFKSPTIRILARYIKGAAAQRYMSIEVSEEKEYYGLSSAQQRLYFLQQMDEGGIAYNMPSVWVLEGDVDKARMADTFEKLIRRHDSLRTSFIMIGEEPAQRIHDELEFKLEYAPYSDDRATVERRLTADFSPRGTGGEPGSHPLSEFIRAFDLSRAPLMRVGLMELKKQNHLLIVDMHHIIADGISSGVLVKDFVALYAGETLPGMRLRYKDCAQWQNRGKESIRVREQARYWQEEFQAEITALDLPTDYIRPTVQRFEGSSLRFEIDRPRTGALKALALEEGVTLYMLLLAIYAIFLAKTGGREDIVIGAPVVGRRHADLENIIGMFVNTLALRCYPLGEKTFAAFLAEVKEKTLQAFENQEYPYEDLVEQVAVNRDVGRNPLFDVGFLFQNMEVSQLVIPGLKLKPYEYETVTSKFDLTLMAMEVEQRLLLTIEYSTGLFKKVTIKRFIRYFRNIVSGILQQRGRKILELTILAEEEKNLLLYDFNDSAVNYPKGKTIHRLFEEQREKTPDHIALIFEDKELTYRELNKRADQLSHLLQSKGFEANSIVGLMVERSLEMIIGILAILKSGSAYLPIDPEYPQDRIDYMLKDSGAKILLTGQEIAGLYSPQVLLNLSEGHNTDFPSSQLPNFPSSFFSSLAYVIYTSGSTGKPKGVLVEHFSVVNLAFSQKNKFAINVKDRVLQFSTICFDASVEQIFIAFLSGAGLVLIDKGTLLDASRFERFIASRSITHLHAVPSFLSNMGLKDTYHLKRIISGGDVCPVSLAKRWARHCDFYNEYGPTETTVTSIEMAVEEVGEILRLPGLPVGRPIGNTFVYVLDKWKVPVPLGVIGELYIGGHGVARGYLNRPELTAQKFQIPDKSLYYRSYRSYMSYITYRTGDLARWLPKGIIEFLGRIDHQVKIRGFRIELEEIEKQLLKHEQIKECVVLALQEKTGDKYLCGYIVPDPAGPFDRASSISAQLKRFLSNSLPGYMIPAYFMELTQLPLTSPGKIDRKSLPEPENIRTGKEYTAPRSDSENKLVEIWEEELDTAPIGIHDDFFDVGGHSLKAIGVVNKIHKHFGVKISVRDLFRFSTIASMVPLIQRSEITGFQEIEKQPEKPYYELSYSQKRLWFIIKKEPHNTSFNMPGMIALHEAVDEVVLRGVLQQLIHRHEGLRTFFKEINREPVQVIEPAAGIKPAIQIIDLSGLEEAQRQDRLLRLLFAESSHIFDLKEAPLLRVKLVKCKTEQYYLVFNMHHIISDGWSIEILKREFNRYYQAVQKGFVIDMRPLEIQYKDYAAWQNQLVANEEQAAKAGEFWRNQLGEGLPVLNLPYDFSAPTAGKESAAYRWVIPEELTNRLRKMGVDHRASLFMVLLAGFNILLSRVTGQKDIITAIPAAARQHDELKNIIGMFVNTLILRNTINIDESFAGFFKHLRDNTFKVLEYQSFPLELICGQLKIKYPTISVLFNMVNIESTHQEKLTNCECYHIEKVQDAKFDIVCYLTEYKNGIEISCHYFKDRFKPITIEKLMNLYTKVLESICREPRQKIWQVGAQSETGKKKILKRKIIKRGE